MAKVYKPNMDGSIEKPALKVNEVGYVEIFETEPAATGVPMWILEQNPDVVVETSGGRRFHVREITP